MQFSSKKKRMKCNKRAWISTRLRWHFFDVYARLSLCVCVQSMQHECNECEHIVWKGRKMLDIKVLLRFLCRVHVIYFFFLKFIYLALWRQHNYECYDLYATLVEAKADSNVISLARIQTITIYSDFGLCCSW